MILEEGMDIHPRYYHGVIQVPCMSVYTEPPRVRISVREGWRRRDAEDFEGKGDSILGGWKSTIVGGTFQVSRKSDGVRQGLTSTTLKPGGGNEVLGMIWEDFGNIRSGYWGDLRGYWEYRE